MVRALFHLMLILGACVTPALAIDSGQWEGTDPSARQWYKTLKQPRSHMPCCGEADAYWADRVEVVANEVFAVITDPREDAPLERPHIEPGTRFKITPDVYKYDEGNPTGHSVIFVSRTGTVYCFVQNGGV